jgi:hypothetical protein
MFQIGHYHYFKIPNLNLEGLKDFLQILDYGKAYIVLLILSMGTQSSNNPFVSLSKQILVTRDSNPNIISNFLFNQLEIASANYGIILDSYTIVFKFRPIALKEEIVQAISKIQYHTKESTNQKKIVTLMNSILYNGTIIPLSMNLDLYGEQSSKFIAAYYILKFKLDPKGSFFTRDAYILYVNRKGSINEGILFANKEIVFKFEDNLIEGNSFVRITNKLIIYIDNLNISYFERVIKNSFITSLKPNVKLNAKIVSFDIETYIKDGKFIPFACG